MRMLSVVCRKQYRLLLVGTQGTLIVNHPVFYEYEFLKISCINSNKKQRNKTENQSLINQVNIEENLLNVTQQSITYEE